MCIHVMSVPGIEKTGIIFVLNIKVNEAWMP